MLWFIEDKFIVQGDCGGKSVTHLVGTDGTCVNCGFVNPPSLQWDHIDGPMLTLANGKVRWLTWWERIMYRFGRRSAEDIARRSAA